MLMMNWAWATEYKRMFNNISVTFHEIDFSSLSEYNVSLENASVPIVKLDFVCGHFIPFQLYFRLQIVLYKTVSACLQHKRQNLYKRLWTGERCL